MKKFISVILLLSLLCVNSFADSPLLTVTYSIMEHSIRLSGTSDKPVSVLVYKYDEDSSDDYADILSEKHLYGALQLDIHTQNTIDEKIALANTVNDEYVWVDISIGGINEKIKLELLSANYKETVRTKVNEALEKENSSYLKSVLESYSDYFHQETAFLEGAAGTYIADMMYRSRNLDNTVTFYPSITDVDKSFNENLLRYSLKSVSDVTGLTSFLVTNGETLGVDSEKYYTPLTADGKTELLSLIKNDNSVANPFGTVFAKKSALAIARTAGSWDDLSKLINNQNYTNILNLGSIHANLGAVTSKMMEKEFNVFEDIKTNYELAVADVNSQIQEGYTPPSLGGGGGGGGGGSVVIGDLFTEDKKIETSDNKPSNSEAVSFSDVPHSHWAYQYITSLASKGVLNGYEDNTFRSSNNITRAEFVKMIVTAFEYNISGSVGNFSDVYDNFWGKKYIDIAYSNGLVSGIGENRFSPDMKITREDAAVIISRCVKKGIAGDYAFNDDSNISSYAKDSVYKLYSLKIINGKEDGIFAPKAFLTRAECAAITDKALTVMSGGAL